MKKMSLLWFMMLMSLGLIAGSLVATAREIPAKIRKSGIEAPRRDHRNTLDASSVIDRFGMKFVDNQAPDTATYQWIELISEPGATRITNWEHATGTTWKQGDFHAPLGSGFTFPMYGVARDSVTITTNGLLVFARLDEAMSADNYELPESYRMIAPFWSNTEARIGGRGCVWYKNFDNQYFVVEWDSIRMTGENGIRYRFEAILFPDGKIKTQYEEIAAPDSSFTIGICGSYYYPEQVVQYGCQITREDEQFDVGENIAAGRAIWFYQDTPEHDFSCMRIIDPEYGPFLVNEQASVIAHFCNIGHVSESSPVSYSLNGVVVSENTDVLAPNSRDTLEFATVLTMPAIDGTYDLAIWTDLTTDGNRANDTLMTSIRVLGPHSCPLGQPVGSVPECTDAPGADCNSTCATSLPIVNGRTYYANSFSRVEGTDMDKYSFTASADSTLMHVTLVCDEQIGIAIYRGCQDIYVRSEYLDRCDTLEFDVVLYEGVYDFEVFSIAYREAWDCHYTLTTTYTEYHRPCGDADSLTIFHNGVAPILRFVAPTEGQYCIYRSTIPGNNGDPRNGNPQFAALDTITAVAGFNSWTDPAPAAGYTNYVVLHIQCESLGRCCYGDPEAPNCANIGFLACQALMGNWNRNLRCETMPCILPNDGCSSPIVVLAGTTECTSEGAAEEIDPPVSEDCTYGGESDVWYVYTPAASGACTISTCETTSGLDDTVIEVFTGTCGALTSIACNDDECDLHSEVTITADAAIPYLIRVMAYSGAGNSFTLTITGP